MRAGRAMNSGHMAREATGGSSTYPRQLQGLAWHGSLPLSTIRGHAHVVTNTRQQSSQCPALAALAQNWLTNSQSPHITAQHTACYAEHAAHCTALWLPHACVLARCLQTGLRCCMCWGVVAAAAAAQTPPQGAQTGVVIRPPLTALLLIPPPAPPHTLASTP